MRGIVPATVNVLMAVVGMALLALTAGPFVFGYKTYVVLSGSMAPAIRTGDVVVAVPVSPSNLRVGDIITYNRSDVAETVTHRIFEIKGDPKAPLFVTKGDANGSPDTWDVKYNGQAGKVLLSIPYAGYFFHAVGSQPGRIVLVVVPGIILVLMWLWEIWRPRIDVSRKEVELPAGLSPGPAPQPAMPAAIESFAERDLAPDTAASLPLRQ